jgi:hypothetical protein
MISPLLVAGLELTPEQRQTLMTRKHKAIVVPIGDIDFSWMAAYSCNLHLLIEEIVQLMLSGDPLDHEFINALARSSTHPDDYNAWPAHGTSRLSEPMKYAKALYARLDEAWKLTRFNNPDISVYGARFERYVGDAIVIEVMYRDIPQRL